MINYTNVEAALAGCMIVHGCRAHKHFWSFKERIGHLDRVDPRLERWRRGLFKTPREVEDTRRAGDRNTPALPICSAESRSLLDQPGGDHPFGTEYPDDIKAWGNTP